MVTFIKRFGARFFALFLLSFPAHSSATTFLPHTNIPADMADEITRRINALPPVYEGDGFVIRHATPANYTAAGPELEANKLPTASLADRIFYQLDKTHTLPNCLLALLGTSHPNAWLEGDSYPERAYAVFKRATGDDKKDTHIGFIHTAPGHKGGRVTGLTKIDYSIFRAYRGNHYAAPMISGFTEYLRGLQGKQLAQFTLPDSDACETAVRTLLAQGDDDALPSLKDLGITSTDGVFTETQVHVSLGNPKSFVAAHRAGLPLIDVQQIWQPDSSFLKSTVTGPNYVSAADLRDLQLDFNAVLVFSSKAPEGDTHLPEPTVALQGAIVTYVAIDKDERPISGIDALRAAVQAHPVSHTMFP